MYICSFVFLKYFLQNALEKDFAIAFTATYVNAG